MTNSGGYKLKRHYDYEELYRRLEVNPRQLEKACRISDLLEDISFVPFLRDRLSLYGGTALAFVHFEKMERLSIDLDFNYRHLDEADWGTIREQIDDRIKKLLYAQSYAPEDLAITATYPLGRITIQYRNHLGVNDSFMIEVGYMRRISILQLDAMQLFRHIGTGETFLIKTPQVEELFANKWCTLLYRGSSRDLFDVYQISKIKFDAEKFRKCTVIDSLMRGSPPLYAINIEELVKSIPIDTGLRNLLLTNINKDDYEEIRRSVINFSQNILDKLTQNEKHIIDRFFRERKFTPELMDQEGILHNKIREHPMIRRILEI